MSTSTRSILIPVVAVSLILGAVGGGVASFFITQYAHPGSSQDATLSKQVSVEEDSATIDVVSKASPSVVTIVASKDVSQIQQQLSPFDYFFGDQTTPPDTNTKQEVSQGTGFIVGSDGMIVTNKHVVADDQAEYTVILSDDRHFAAHVVAKDPTNDVAIVDIEATGLPTLALGDSDKVKIGETVIAIGDPLSFRNSATKGIISGKSRTITASDGQGQAETLEDIFQTDAAINPGNSGGPLIDLGGSVIAVNTAVSQEGQLIGFAIPINVIKRDLDSVKQSGRIIRPFLGVRYVAVTEDYAKTNKLSVDYGALIQKGANGDAAVLKDSPADKAGLKENDIILTVEGQKITEDHSLTGILSKYSPGDTVTLKVLHDGKEKEVKVVLEERK